MDITLAPVPLSPSIFKAYDIRGVIGKTLDSNVAFRLGLAFGEAVLAKNEHDVVVGRDGRLSGPELSAALAKGLQASGVNVIDIGSVVTPMVYFGSHVLKAKSGIMVTGSHNPPDYNGFKMVLAGEAIYGETIQKLYRTIIALPTSNKQTTGAYVLHDIGLAYLERIISDIKLARPMKIAVDCGNGIAGAFAANLYRKLGCQVDELFCDVDGTFPHHHPDPAQLKNLQDLITHVKNSDAELGLAFDGDGDRLGVVTKNGHVIYPDRQLMLFAEDVLTRHPGAQILYDVKCTRHLASWVKARGGNPVMWKTGHSLIKAKMRETGAPLGGEMSGHIFFKDRWYGFDDGLYAGARLLELLSRVDNPSKTLDALPQSISTPELQLALNEGENFALIAKMQEEEHVKKYFSESEKIVSIDGLRVEYENGFGLVRSSNTTPVIVMRFEADTTTTLTRIQTAFKCAILAIKPDAQLPF
ncbi:MAG: phosphomannomutase/phosphoglucomutase [Solimicrobium sp.]|jgi:phosphomannomutase/phosphoglucomutase|nr:phosphomannomutase/phosphoglucomutase [Solimicrobium sp.]